MANEANEKENKRGEEYGVRHFTVDTATTLLDFVQREQAIFVRQAQDQALREASNQTNSTPQLSAEELIEFGAVYLNKLRNTNKAQTLKSGDSLRVHFEPRRFKKPHESKIEKETNEYIVVHKPAGIPVHALVDNLKENLIAFLENERKEKLYVTHRLDVETSGQVLIARTPEAQAKYNELFAQKKVKRLYKALTQKEVPIGNHVHFVEPSPKAPKIFSSEDHEGWQRCEMIVRSCTPQRELRIESLELESSPLPHQVFAIEIDLLTGRTHQIRGQLSMLNAPIIGDRLYGSEIEAWDKKTQEPAIALYAWKLEGLE